MKKLIIILFVMFGCNQSKDEANIFFLKGNVAFKDKNYKQAIDYYNEAINKDKNFADVYNNLGICYQKMGDLKNAEINFNLATEKDEKFVDAKLNYANLLLNSNPTKSLELLKTIEKQLTDSAKYCNTRGQAEFFNNDFSKASFYLQKAVQKEPKNAEFLTNLGTLLYYQKNLKEAENNFIKSFKIDSSNAMTVNNLGLIYSKTNTKNAENFFKKGLELESNNNVILNNYAYFLIQKKEFQLAAKYITFSENIDAKNPYLIRNKALCLLQSDKKGGLELLLSAFNQNASIENIYTEIGNAYALNNNKVKADEYLQKGKLLK